MTYKITDSVTGELLRYGVCQPADLDAQARDGEEVSPSSDEEITALKAAVVPETAIETKGDVPIEIKKPIVRLPPIDPVAVVVRALRNAGIEIKLDEARAQIVAEISAKMETAIKNARSA